MSTRSCSSYCRLRGCSCPCANSSREGEHGHPRPREGSDRRELRRIHLPRIPVNRVWALLRASPLHGVDDLLRLGRELIEMGRPASVAQGDRQSAQLVLRDDQVQFASLRDENRRVMSAYPEEVHALLRVRYRGTHPGMVVLRQRSLATATSSCRPLTPPTLMGSGSEVFRYGWCSNHPTRSLGALTTIGLPFLLSS